MAQRSPKTSQKPESEYEMVRLKPEASPLEEIGPSISLSEKIRPDDFADYVGQSKLVGEGSVLRNLLDKNVIPSMILWGSHGCGKTTLAHIISNYCNKHTESMRFVKMSASTSGINDVKEVVRQAINFQEKFQKETILFMDDIHRMSRLEQDGLLSPIENGTLVLIGATTENPKINLNASLMRHCKVLALRKLTSTEIGLILRRALRQYKAVVVRDDVYKVPSVLAENLDYTPSLLIHREALKWLADMADGDAKIALNSLEMTMKYTLSKPIAQDESVKLISIEEINKAVDQFENKIKLISLKELKETMKKSQNCQERSGDARCDLIAALNKSIQLSDDNAALYYCTRLLLAEEDPKNICRRMIRLASEEIGLADSQALIIASQSLQAIEQIGMPKAECIIAQCVIYLARAPKSMEAKNALSKCKMFISKQNDQPLVPKHLQYTPKTMIEQLGRAVSEISLPSDDFQKSNLPDSIQHINFFK